jgi:phage protein D
VAEVSYLLKIDGREAPLEVVEAVQRLELEEHASLASIMRLTVAIAVAEGGSRWTIVDDEVFPRLGEVSLSIKVGSSDPEPILSGYVIEARAVFGEEPNASTLDVLAMDATVLMNLEEKVRAWPNMADSDIASSIFGEYDLSPVVDDAQPTRQEDDVIPIQRGTDMQFLRWLAERNGYDLFVATSANGAEGHFHAPKLDDPPQGVLTVGFGSASNVPSLTITHETLRPTTAKAEQLDVLSQESQSGEAETVSLADLGGTSVLTGDQRRATLLARTGLVDTAELQTYAQAIVDRSSWAVRAEGQVASDHYDGILRARKPVSVRGVGKTLSGTYYVERVLHVFTADEYSQQFTLRRNALTLSGQEDFSESQALAS